MRGAHCPPRHREVTMHEVTWDLETFSQINLKEHGAYIYATHPSTGVHFMCYAIDDGEVQVWRPRRSTAGAVHQSHCVQVRGGQLDIRERDSSAQTDPAVRIRPDPDRESRLRPTPGLGECLSGRAWVEVRGARLALSQGS